MPKWSSEKKPKSSDSPLKWNPPWTKKINSERSFSMSSGKILFLSKISKLRKLMRSGKSGRNWLIKRLARGRRKGRRFSSSISRTWRRKCSCFLWMDRGLMSSRGIPRTNFRRPAPQKCVPSKIVRKALSTSTARPEEARIPQTQSTTFLLRTRAKRKRRRKELTITRTASLWRKWSPTQMWTSMEGRAI